MAGKRLPVLCLLACTALLWGAWQFAPDSETREPAETDLPTGPMAIRPRGAPLRPLSVRVGLTPAPVRSLSLEITGPFRVRPVGNAQVLFDSKSLRRTTVVAAARGLKIGTRELPATRIEITPSESPAIWVGDHQYRGSVRIFAQKGGTLIAVNVLPLEDYVASVVDSEMPGDFPDEARKAQAIIARTYALYQMRQAPPGAAADLFASTRSQKYLGYQYRDSQGRLLAGESDSSRKVAAATRDRVCTYRGRLFCTYYCAVCGGSTVLGTEVFSDAAPPLQSVKCDWCREAKLYRWTAEVSRSEAQSELAELLAQQGNKPGRIRTVSAVRGAPAGGLPQFDVRDDRRAYRVSGADLRQALAGHGLYSPRFSVEDKGSKWLITGRGHGHGVGLCQWGARGLALAGKSCEQILAYYYRGSQVELRR